MTKDFQMEAGNFTTIKYTKTEGMRKRQRKHKTSFYGNKLVVTLLRADNLV